MTHVVGDPLHVEAHNADEAAIAALQTSVAGKSNTGHTHAESDVTSLTTDLAGKAAVSHTHTPYDFTPPDLGWLAWSYDPVMAGNNATATAGTLYFQKLHLPASAVVTSVVLSVITAGITLTTGQCFAGLWRADGTGALIAATADQSTNWQSIGLKTMALVGGPYSLAAGDYYVGYWTQGATQPSFGRSTNAGVMLNGNLASPNLRMGTANTGLTTTAPNPMGAQTGTGSGPPWAALS